MNPKDEFSWKCISFKKNKFRVQLKFKHPYDVSLSDTIEVSFLDFDFYADERYIKNDLILKESLTEQIPSKSESMTLKAVGGVLTVTLGILIVLVIVGQKVGQIILKSTWPFFCDF